MRLARLLFRLPALAIAALIVACGDADARSLDDLVVRDSVYMDPTSGEAFTGRVVRHFEDDTTSIQLEGRLLEGVWDGEMIVYHPNGRVRYMGSFADGDRCGPWVENADSVPTRSVYEDLVREVESMGLYPPCEDSS